MPLGNQTAPHNPTARARGKFVLQQNRAAVPLKNNNSNEGVTLCILLVQQNQAAVPLQNSNSNEGVILCILLVQQNWAAVPL